MCTIRIRSLSNYLVVLAWFLLVLQTATAQDKPAKPEKPNQPEQDDVIRVNTELVQTDVMVFDKKGNFVAGLKPEQFVLKIDNKPQPVAFFEQVSSGSLRETKSKQTTDEVP